MIIIYYFLWHCTYLIPYVSPWLSNVLLVVSVVYQPPSNELQATPHKKNRKKPPETDRHSRSCAAVAHGEIKLERCNYLWLEVMLWCLLARVVVWGLLGGRWMPWTSCEEATVIGPYSTPHSSTEPVMLRVWTAVPSQRFCWHLLPRGSVWESGRRFNHHRLIKQVCNS